MQAGRSRGIWGGIVAAAACVVALVTAPAAFGAFELTNLSAAPADTNAGANSDFAISLDTPDTADLKDLTIHLPPGLVGNPLATTTCTEDQLNADACPAASDVGDVSNAVTLTVQTLPPPIPPLSLPQTVNGNLYNVVPRAGEPARFGIVLDSSPIPGLPGGVFPKIILQSGAVLRPSDLGLDTVLNDLPNSAQVASLLTAGVHINSTSLTLSGKVGNPPKGFIRNPTSCGTHTVGFDADSYDGQTATGSTTFDTVNCEAEPFTPELSAHVKPGPKGEAVEVSTTISQTIEEAGLQTAQVTLPKELFGSGAVGRGCLDADFQAGNCPPNTIVGTAVAASPLQSQPLTGPVALVQAGSAPGGLPDIGLDLRGALGLKLKGTVALTPDARNVVTFAGLPDIPISEFTLTFSGGPGGITFATKDLCTDPKPPLIFDADFASFSGATLHVSPTATVDCSGASGGGPGGGGGAVKPPKAKISLSGAGSKHPRLGMSVKKGSEKLKSVKLTLPEQLQFGSARAFDRGASIRGGKKVKAKHTNRKLTLTAKKAVDKFGAKLGDGAVLAAGGSHAKLLFKLKVTDKTGKTTKLTVRPK
jgi:hypothetical protein